MCPCSGLRLGHLLQPGRREPADWTPSRATPPASPPGRAENGSTASGAMWSTAAASTTSGAPQNWQRSDIASLSVLAPHVWQTNVYAPTLAAGLRRQRCQLVERVLLYGPAGVGELLLVPAVRAAQRRWCRARTRPGPRTARTGTSGFGPCRRVRVLGASGAGAEPPGLAHGRCLPAAAARVRTAAAAAGRRRAPPPARAPARRPSTVAIPAFQTSVSGVRAPAAPARPGRRR